jgi:8-oxo-dGTP diphosphatase
MLRVVCGVVVDRSGRVLCCQRMKGSQAGYWEFAGGKIELGETPKEALARELQEELGIEVEVGDALPVVTYQYPHFHIELLPFWCKILSGEPEMREHSQVIWCEVQMLQNLVWSAADSLIVKGLQVL